MESKKLPSELLKLFYSEIDCSELTRSTYILVLGLFAKHLALSKQLLTTASLRDVIAFKTKLKAERSPRTVRLYMTVIKRFYEWCADNGYYSNIAKGLSKERISKGFRRLPLTIDQVQTLLDSIDVTTLGGQRDWCMINFMVNTGLRRTEVSKIDIDDLFRLNDKYCIRLQRKGHSSKDQTKLINEEIYLMLVNLVGKDKPKGTPVFVTQVQGMEQRRLSSSRIAQIVKERLKLIGLTDKRYSCHSMRHTTAFLLYKQGKDMYAIMEYLGHSSIATTQLYMLMIREMEALDDASANMLNECIKKRTKK